MVLDRKEDERRVLILSSEFPPGPGGIGTNAYNLCNELTKLRWSVSIVSSQDYSHKNDIKIFNSAQSFRIKRLACVPFVLFKAVYRFCVYFKEALFFLPNLLLATGKHAVMMAVVVKKILRRPLIAIIHADELLEEDPVAFFLYKQVDRVISVSNWTAELANKKAMIPKEKIEIIFNGGDENIFYPEAKPQKLEKRFHLKGKKVILTVGNISLRKGQDLVIKALPAVLKRIPDVVYVMVGLPTEKQRFQEIAKMLGLCQQVIFAGTVSSKDLRDYYNLCDVFILPSRVLEGKSAEGFGIVVVEAMLCQKPVIVTGGSGPEEIVLHKNTGLVVKPESPEAIAEAVIEVLSDEVIAQEMARKGREGALKKYTWAKCAFRYNKVMEETIKSRQ